MKNSKGFNFNLKAFFFTFAYYVAEGNWLLFVASFVSALIVPIRFYFIVGLILGFMDVKTNRNNSHSIWRVLLACISIVIFCIVKSLTIKFI